MAKGKDLHDGHRERMMEKFRKNGIGVFEDHEKLEVLLYQILPRINTNDIAHELINNFGSLKNVLLEPVEDLVKIKGIGEKSALQLKFIGDLMNYLNTAKVAVKIRFSSTLEIVTYCLKHLTDKTHEVLLFILLDDKSALLHAFSITNSQPNHIQISYREVSKQIMKYDASKLIIAHNHLIGSAEPSDDDQRFTRKLYDYLNMLSVGLVDHIIIGRNDVLSMRDNGYLGNIWDD